MGVYLAEVRKEAVVAGLAGCHLDRRGSDDFLILHLPARAL